MNEGLREVTSAAGEAMAGGTDREAGRRAPPLRAVVTASVPSLPPAAPSLPIGVLEPAFGGDDSPLGRGGLRLAFWLCGFQESLAERRRKGERLSEREEALLALARKEFVNIRPRVIELALGRLQAVVNSAELLPLAEYAPGGALPIEPMQAFAVGTLRGLSAQAALLLRDHGPDAALSLFGDGASVQEPLAIFQLIFTTAHSLVEGFQKVMSSDALWLARLAETLGSEVERV